MATSNSCRILFASLVILAGVGGIALVYQDRYGSNELLAADGPVAKSEPQELFTHWPKDRKPDLVLLITGQTFSYIQKCGCSNPQKGGLERRYNFMEMLRAKGWEVVGLDLGDVLHALPYTPTDKQTLTKYEYSMQSMKIMGYQAVGVGKEELGAQLVNPLQKYSLQKGNETPKVHFANIENRDEFPNASGGSSLVESDLITAKSGLSVGVLGIVGNEIIKQGLDNSVKFSPKAGPVITKVLKGWEDTKKSPELNVLLYQGPKEWTDPISQKKSDAESVSKEFPQFQIVVCLSNDSEPPNMPTILNNNRTMLLQVGHKGQNVGVVGVYKIDNAIQLFYQRVTMTDEFDTPPEKEANHPILKTLQEYSDTVKANDYLSEMVNRKKLHPVQAQFKQATYVGAEKCAACHESEKVIWSQSKHAHAYEGLEKGAKKPTGRHFDGECIICHTVGYDFKTGYVNEKSTAHLKNVQCESCHGPGSLHVDEENANLKAAKPTNKYLATLSPWKAGGNGKLPSVQTFAAMAAEKDQEKKYALMTESEKKVYQGVHQTCSKCHDIENDPKFELYDYWKNIVHSGFGKKKK